MPRPKTPLISRERTAEAALELVAERGLDTFTLNALARHLGVRAPSLYYHFDDKTDILEASARALLVGVAPPRVPDPDDWQSWFRAMCLDTYRHVMQRPRAAALLLEHFPRTLVFAAHDLGSGLLISAGVPVGDVATVLRGIEKLTFGLILADASEVIDGRSESAQATADEWPAYRAALNANPRDSEQMFRETIDVFLDGIGARYLTMARGA